MSLGGLRLVPHSFQFEVEAEGCARSPAYRQRSDPSFDVDLGDLDGDVDLDVYVVTVLDTNRVYLNDGLAAFSDSGLRLSDADSHDVALGDVDADGDLDAYIANSFASPDEVWLNGCTDLEVEVTDTLPAGVMPTGPIVTNSERRPRRRGGRPAVVLPFRWNGLMGNDQATGARNVPLAVRSRG